jgi:cytochrome c-type biogenesis protein CcmH/NrfG
MAESIEQLRRHLAALPNDRELMLRLGRECMKAAWSSGSDGDALYREAKYLYFELVNRDPADSVALVNLGTVISDCGGHEAALVYYRRAEEQGFKDRRLRFNMSVALINLRRVD